MKRMTLLVAIICLVSVFGIMITGCGAPKPPTGNTTPTVSGTPGAATPGASNTPEDAFALYKDSLLAGDLEATWGSLSKKGQAGFGNKDAFLQRMRDGLANPKSKAQLESFTIQSTDKVNEKRVVIAYDYLRDGVKGKLSGSEMVIVLEDGTWKVELEPNPSTPPKKK